MRKDRHLDHIELDLESVPNSDLLFGPSGIPADVREGARERQLLALI
jgi:hypothetical protein